MDVSMKRFIADAHEKLRRMVEEHSTKTTENKHYQPPLNSMEIDTASSTSSTLTLSLLNDKSSTNNNSPSNNNNNNHAGAVTTSSNQHNQNYRNTLSLNPSTTPTSKDTVTTTTTTAEILDNLNNKLTAAIKSKARSSACYQDDHRLRQSDDESRLNGLSSVNDDDKEGLSSSAEGSGSCKNGSEFNSIVPCPSEFDNRTTIRRLHEENQRLKNELGRLKKLIISNASRSITSATDKSKTIAEESSQSEKNGNCSSSSDVNDASLRNRSYEIEIELELAREAISALKCDKRKLKIEKYDLIHQMKQLYSTLDDKECELREFIRNFEQRSQDNETSYQQLSNEREERERERWSLLRHARDEAERSLSLAAQLNAKEVQLQQLQDQLHEFQAKRLLTANGCYSDQDRQTSLSTGLLTTNYNMATYAGDRGSCSADSGVRLNSDRESGGAASVGGNLSDSTVDVVGLSVKDRSPNVSPISSKLFSHSIDSGVLSRSVEHLNSPPESEPVITFPKRMKNFPARQLIGRGGTWGSISRVFARSKNRNKSSILQNNSSYDSFQSWSPLTEEGYTEKLKLLREASTIPMERWKASAVLAWIEIALGMPQYGPKCAENVKSGKIRGFNGQVLLELSDLEIECGLGINHPMHRKKLRLAIEEHRNPAAIRYQCIGQLGHTWVSSEWLPDLGLTQYVENFASNMVDARMLEHLSKKELEKYLCVTRKFHQASIVHGIHLLRIIKYDRQSLAMRRHQCESIDADPIVWTNQRFIRWAKSIDLSEYADNLKDSGVHGALVVLESSFNGDTMATALGIPPSKNIIRRHLTAEFEALILPARSTLEHYIRARQNNSKTRVPGGSLGRSFSRSCGGNLAVASNEPNESRRSFRDSLSRAFGLKSKSDHEKQSPTSSSENSVISRISFQPHQQQQPQAQLLPQYPLQLRYNHSNNNNHQLNYKHNNSLYSEIGSPIYATPLALRQSLVYGSFMKNSISETEDYEVPYDVSNGNTRTSSCSSYAYDNNYFNGLDSFDPNSNCESFLINDNNKRNRKFVRRRVKSISDIDSIPVSNNSNNSES